MINLNSSVCRDWKIISIDTKISMIPWESDIKNSLWNICVGVWVSGQPRANFLHISKDAKLNSASFDTSIVTGRRWEQIVLCKKLLEKWILRGLKLRRFDQNQVNHDKRLYQNVENTEVMQSANFNLKPPTHIDATHAISKFDQNFQNWISRVARFSESFAYFSK